jgi:hypothetical protein
MGFLDGGHSRRYGQDSTSARALAPAERVVLGGFSGVAGLLMCWPLLAANAASDSAFRADRPFLTSAELRKHIERQWNGGWDLVRRHYDNASWERDPRGQRDAMASRATLHSEARRQTPRRATLFACTLGCRDTLKEWLVPFGGGGGFGVGSLLTSTVLPFASNAAVGSISGFMGIAVSYPLHYDPTATKEILHYYVNLGRPSMEGTFAENMRRMYDGFGNKAPMVTVTSGLLFGVYDTVLPWLLPASPDERAGLRCAATRLLVAMGAATLGRLIAESMSDASVQASRDAYDAQFVKGTASTSGSLRRPGRGLGIPKDFMQRLPSTVVRVLPAAAGVALYDSFRASILISRGASLA